MRRPAIPLLPRWLRWAGVLGVATVVVYYSLVRAPPGPPGPTSFWDKRLHFVAYAGVALVTAYATAHDRDRPVRRAVVVLGGAIAFGAAIELLQAPLPARYFGWGDLLANCLGAAVVALWFPLEARFRYVRARRLLADGDSE